MFDINIEALEKMQESAERDLERLDSLPRNTDKQKEKYSRSCQSWIDKHACDILSALEHSASILRESESTRMELSRVKDLVTELAEKMSFLHVIRYE